MPRDRACPLEPPAQYRGLRISAPLSRAVLWDGSEVWLASRYADVRQLLTEPRASANTSRPGFPFVRAGGSRARQDLMTALPLASLDPPKHGKIRRILLSEFASRKVERRRAVIQTVVDNLIDHMEEHHREAALSDATPVIDLVGGLALSLPSRIIAGILGVPYEDSLFQTDAALASSADPAVVAPAYRRLSVYLDDLIRAKEQDPADDLLSRLVQEHLHTGSMTRAELVANAYQLLSAGHRTTTSMIALGTLLLIQHPDQLARLRSDPGLASSAVEELLRYLTVAQHVTHRVASEDLTIAGQTIRAGEAIIALIASANRDPDAFSAPDAFDIGREHNNHFAFGMGAHFCLGAALARLELQVVFGTLFSRLPEVRLAVSPDELKFEFDGEVFGLAALPVTW